MFMFMFLFLGMYVCILYSYEYEVRDRLKGRSLYEYLSMAPCGGCSMYLSGALDIYLVGVEHATLLDPEQNQMSIYSPVRQHKLRISRKQLSDLTGEHYRMLDSPI